MVREGVKVSIIVPTYNRRELICETIESIVRQSYTNWELIVVDDGSSDGTNDIIRNYIKKDKRVHYFNRPPHLPKGANSCRNYGLSKCTGQFVKWVDSDDILKKNNLELQVTALIEDTNKKVCLGYSQFFFNTTDKLENYWSRTMESDKYFVDHLKNNIRWHLGAMLWRREWFHHEPFANSLMNSQEWLMHSFALLDLEKNQIYNLKEIIYLVRRGHNRISSQNNSDYYYHQIKARVFLVLGLIRRGRLSFLSHSELGKQIIVYTFYYLKSHFKELK